jgi:hypothetical protein
MPARLDTFISYESAAARIEAYISAVVPGMLQTREYATEAFRRLVPSLTGDEIDQQVELRMRRQRELRGRQPAPTLRLTVPETVLRRTVGNKTVMQKQLQTLIDCYDDPSVDLFVVPFSAGLYQAAEFAPMTHFHFEDALDPDVIAIEIPTSIQFLDGRDRIRRHRESFAGLGSVQLARQESRDFIRRLLE